MLARHPRRTFLLLSAALLLLLYGRTLAAPFLYDDLDQILNNPALASWHTFAPRFLLHPVDLTTTFLGHGGSTWRPVFWLSLFLDRSLYGLNPAGFHATNLVLHLLNANLLFALLRLLLAPQPSASGEQSGNSRRDSSLPIMPQGSASPLKAAPKTRRSHRRSAVSGPHPTRSLVPAAAAALLWLVLPVNSEVVAWISARAYLLATALLLTALLALLAHIHHPTRTALALCVFAATAAPLAHELGLLTLPLALLLLTSIVLGSKADQSRPASPTLARAKIPLALIALADAAILALRHHLTVHTTSGLNPPLFSLQAFGEYLALTLLPLHLSVERSTTLLPHQLHPALLLATTAFALTLAAAIALRRRLQPAVPFGLAWFLLAIGPFCLVVNYQGIAERLAYLATIGLAITLSAALLLPKHRAAPAVFALIALAAITRTAARVADWTDPIRLYTSSLRANPQSPSLHYNLAFALRQRGNLESALRELQTTLTLDRAHPHAFASLGDTYLDLHQDQAALTAYHQALLQSPNDPAVLLNLAAALNAAGNPAAAESTYNQLLAQDPGNASAHIDLGVLLQQQNRPNDAMHQFAMAIDLKSTDPVPFYNLAVLFQQAGRPDLALVLYKKVLDLRPNDPDTLRNLQLLPHTR